jgi:hypothetical protein
MSLMSRLAELKGKAITVKSQDGIEIKRVNADRGYDVITDVEEDCFVVKHSNGVNIVYSMSSVIRIFI